MLRKIKKNIKRSNQLKIGKLPFTIHASPEDSNSPYPTHTHGLHDIGWPEFFIDPQAFGPNGNGDRINRSYLYFKKPKNAGKLEAILNGQIIEIPIKILIPEWRNAPLYTLCYRLAPHDFEGVKLAYGLPGLDFDPEMKFVQIWVKGDDYVLMDAYYIGGIKW